ncbi:efflux transporter periplasmic adaptor subunit [Flavobacterium aquidurense]|uniref:efflux RND transporter periplasmic adaptor subunit n=1 Tax=Flavobacterium aquidurense TaxID=362413 RepID=UPI00091EFCEE|nr:efflux RND transporter periplasmic adaptor subunit [Flavobacterium aquidurense]OXA69060.1 efflux transporter periplasmic adaptor subunit [Flavobacterium aquidurense]SHH86017.1 membrane fusion protein, cobalt-zinc-cadmium efflux system [Flavobacterium frigidimaris]
MKKSNIIYAVGAAVVIAIILYFTLRKTDAEVPKEEAKTEEKQAAGIKEVELNEAQFTGSQIELGGFSQKNLSDVINANGYTKLPPQNQADVSVFTTGIVKSISVIEGQHVNKGQVIATIESPEFAKIQEAYLTSKSNLEYLKLEFERQKTLSAEEVNSKKVFQQTKSNYEIEKARFSSLQRQLSTLNINPNGAATSTVAVKAPISGFITEINIKLGSNVEAGKPLLGIVDNSKLHVDLLVYEKDLRKVKPGQDVRFILTNQDNTEIKGKIFSVGKSFENETKSVAVHADIINDKQQLIPGMYINALIDIGIKSVSALPLEAIVKADGREFIFVLEEGHKEEESHDDKQGHAHDDGDKHEENEGKTYHFQRIEVKTGTSQLGFIQVTLLQKIDAGSKIVTKGAYYIQSHLLKSEGGGGHDH